MSKGIGRNNPCHCGCGKIYKRCHLASDRQRRATVHVPSSVAPSPSATAGLAQTASLLRELPRLLPKKDRAEIEQLLGPALSAVAYHERRDEIEAAAQKLEAYRDEFVALAKDVRAYLVQARTLFAEAPFAPLWFTVEDIQRAFDRVGDLSYPANDPRIAKTLEAAILFLAGEDRRAELARRLMLHLPAFVAAGRHLDAWVIQDCACATVENAERSNPFLFEMFAHGFDAWHDRKSLQVQSVFRKAGMDPDRLNRMSMGEIEAWLRSMRDNPAAAAQLEAALERDPEREARKIADLG